MEYKIDYFKLIKEKLGMEQLLRHYGHTKDPSGKWNCPFHPDVAPNDFSVTNNEIGKCWSSNCGKWGDIYDIIQAKENCSKFEALKKAAEMAGVQIQFDNKSKEELEKLARLKEQQKRRIDVLTAAAEIFHQNLSKEKREKLKQERGWTDETIDNFKIGFSVSGIKQRLISRGFSESDILGGLVSEKGYEYYQNRIMFPYLKNGKVVYVIGRETEETPENDFMKGKYIKLKKDYMPNVIYNTDGLNKTQELFISEGVADCISIHQAGFSCISPVTIRFKKDDFPELLKYAKNKDVFIANDNESSDEGMRGAVDTAKYLFENGVSNVQIITIPKPEDIDKIDMCDYLKSKEDKNFAVKELINNHSKHILDFLIDNIKNKTDFNSINEVLDLMASNDSAILDPFLNGLKKKSGITTRSAIKKIRKIKEQLKKQQAEQQQRETPEVQEDVRVKKEYSDEKDVYLGIKRFNNPTKLYTPKDNVIYTHKIYGLKNDASYFETVYDLYKAFVAVGNDPIFIFSSKYDKIEAGETKQAVFYIDTEKTLNSDLYSAEIELTYENDNNKKIENLGIDLPVQGIPQFSISGITTNPSKVMQGDSVTLKINIKNMGEKEGKDTSIKVFEKSDQPFDFEEKTNYIGTINPDSTGTAVLRFSVDKDATPTDYLLSVQIRTVYNGEVLVSEETIPIKVYEYERTTEDYLKIGGLITGGIFIVLILLLVFRRRK